jgi:hypothetical protein
MRTRREVALRVTLLVIGPAVAGVSFASEPAEARPGARVRVTTGPSAQATSGQPGVQHRTVIGTLLDADGDAITVLRRGGEDRVHIARTAIRRLEVARGRTRGRSTLIGAGIGAGVGLGVAVIEHHQCKGEFMCGVEFVLPVLTTPVGALVGFAAGKQQWVNVSPMGGGLSILPRRRGVQVAWVVRF